MEPRSFDAGPKVTWAVAARPSQSDGPKSGVDIAGIGAEKTVFAEQLFSSGARDIIITAAVFRPHGRSSHKDKPSVRVVLLYRLRRRRRRREEKKNK